MIHSTNDKLPYIKHGTKCQGEDEEDMTDSSLQRPQVLYFLGCVVRPEIAPDSYSGESEFSLVWEIKQHPLILELCLSASYLLDKSQTKVSATAKVSTLSSSRQSETSKSPRDCPECRVVSLVWNPFGHPRFSHKSNLREKPSFLCWPVGWGFTPLSTKSVNEIHNRCGGQNRTYTKGALCYPEGRKCSP